MGLNVYSQMCIQAKPIQDIKDEVGWFDQYDTVVNKSSGMILLAIQLPENRKTLNLLWQPNQEQISALIDQNMPTNNFIGNFNSWHSKDKPYYMSIPGITLNMLLLMFYMETVHQLFWCWGCGFWKDVRQKEQYISDIMNSKAVIRN